uniref:Putative sulfotransferase n=1 Tax=Amblyomma triste TaxID=251400 RepID=A0A023GI41_AMBTT
MNFDSLKDIDDVLFLDIFSEDNVRSSMKYEPRAGDVIIVTYPKCGTTWTQYIVSNILTKANVPSHPGEYMLYTPFIELLGSEAAMNPSRKGPLMTHLPLKNMIFSKQAKYIYVARNPYDCCVSAYYFLKGLTPKSHLDVSFETFVQNFISGKVFYGDYFDHLLGWYKLRNEPNVLFILYEQLKEETEKWTLKIAEFLGKEHCTALRNDRTLLDKILQLSSLEKMKVTFNYNAHDRIQGLLELSSRHSLKFLDKLNKRPGKIEEMHEGAGFVRKGIIGDWRNHFTSKQVDITKEWIAKKTSASDVMLLWSAYDLP